MEISNGVGIRVLISYQHQGKHSKLLPGEEGWGCIGHCPPMIMSQFIFSRDTLPSSVVSLELSAVLLCLEIYCGHSPLPCFHNYPPTPLPPRRETNVHKKWHGLFAKINQMLVSHLHTTLGEHLLSGDNMGLNKMKSTPFSAILLRPLTGRRLQY